MFDTDERRARQSSGDKTVFWLVSGINLSDPPPCLLKGCVKTSDSLTKEIFRKETHSVNHKKRDLFRQFQEEKLFRGGPMGLFCLGTCLCNICNIGVPITKL